MLRAIKGTSIDKLPFDNLRLISDLIYFDGPLLSFFKDSNGQRYLYYWCDSDNIYNRWLAFKTTEQALSGFLTQQLTLHDLILAYDNEHMYVVDIDDEVQYANIVKIRQPSDLPADYLPEVDTYYDASLSVFHDEQAARELMTIMQRALQEAQTKLAKIEQIVARNHEAIGSVLSAS